MQKSLFSLIYVLSLLTAGLTIRQAFADRGPSVEPITEVSFEDNRPARKPGQVESGFDFGHKSSTINTSTTIRVPANIATKQSSTPYSLLGPMIFLFALPLALWIVIAKKVSKPDGEKKLSYYSKTYQFKPNKTEYQDFDDDQDYPKAS